MKPALATRESRLTPLEGPTLQLVLGCLLGDAHLDIKPTHPRIRLIHGPKQKLYLEYKARMLSNYIQTPPKEILNSGFGKSSIVACTVTTPAFEFLRSICTQHARKTVTPEWLSMLTWEGVAFWFMDDGHITTKSSTSGISTHGFSQQEVTLLAQWLADRGVAPTIDLLRTPSGRQCFGLRFRRTETSALIEMIRPFVPPCMAYKTALSAPYPSLPCIGCNKMLQGSKRRPTAAGTCCGSRECRRIRHKTWRLRRTTLLTSNTSATVLSTT
jgi:hypothetical protein